MLLHRLTNKGQQASDSDELVLPEFLIESPLAEKVNERLISPFNVMTTFFLRRSVEKAFQIDESPTDLTLKLQRPPASNPPHITSAVDDIMYIVNKVIEQSLATGQLPVVTNVVPTTARVLGSDFIGMIQRKMRDETYPKPVVPGGLPPEGVVIAFIILINNLDVAIDYVQRIVKNIQGSAASAAGIQNSENRILNLFPLGTDAEIVNNALRSLSSSFESKAQDLIGDGIQVVFNNVVKTRLRPILADAFRDLEYQPQPHEGGEMSGEDDIESNDFNAGQSLARRRFASLWRELLVPISRILTSRTFDRLLGVTVASLARLLEKRIWSYHGRINALGATRLERDVTGIITAAVDVGEGYAGGESDGGSRYRHREAFARCAQIVLVAGLEDEEWEEIEKSGGDVVDKLSTEERARARAMIV